MTQAGPIRANKHQPWDLHYSTCEWEALPTTVADLTGSRPSCGCTQSPCRRHCQLPAQARSMPPGRLGMLTQRDWPSGACLPPTVLALLCYITVPFLQNHYHHLKHLIVSSVHSFIVFPHAGLSLSFPLCISRTSSCHRNSWYRAPISIS